MIEEAEYRVVMVLPSSHQALVVKDRGEARLPRVTIPKETRPAEQLTAAIRERWQINTIVIDFLAHESTQLPCAAVEVRQQQNRADQPWTSVGIHLISSRDVSESERDTLNAILAGETGSRGPFSRIGWVDDMREWIKCAVRDREVEFTDDLRQLNASGTGALVRFGTKHRPAYWLKAADDQNVRELRITKHLAREYPDYLPRLVAVREGWSAWVAEEFGESLEQSFIPGLPILETTVGSLADLQKRTIGRTDALLDQSCFDQRLDILQAHLNELIEYLQEAMEQQTSTRVAKLERSRLRQLGGTVRDACAKMQELEIPDTLIHNDLNFGSVLTDGSRCVFTDWSEACVGNPFLTFEHFCVHLRRSVGGKQGSERLRTRYQERWLGYLSESQIEHAFVLARLLAIVSYMYGSGAWLHSPRRSHPDFCSYNRSLARHMDRAAREPQLLEVLCQ